MAVVAVLRDEVADRYRRFADVEARGISETYFGWAMGVVEDPVLLDLIRQLPKAKTQPNLVFAAARSQGAPIGGYGHFRDWLVEHWALVRPVIESRSTQTNEAARCAVLLPVLSAFDGPLALIEAGTSAGLCLHPERYSYRYDTGGSIAALDPRGGVSDVIIPCTIDESSVPSRLPEVVWRAGVDLNPLDPADPDTAAWLDTLVWPEHNERRVRLAAALKIAAKERAHIVAGDLVDAIPNLIAQAPSGAPIVVFHSAVLTYLEPSRRQQFVELMRSASAEGVAWVSNEGEGVLERVAQRLPWPSRGRHVIAVNERPVALVGPHGQSYEPL